MGKSKNPHPDKLIAYQHGELKEYWETLNTVHLITISDMPKETKIELIRILSSTINRRKKP